MQPILPVFAILANFLPSPTLPPQGPKRMTPLFSTIPPLITENQFIYPTCATFYSRQKS